jgi:hypothetical protein
VTALGTTRQRGYAMHYEQRPIANALPPTCARDRASPNGRQRIEHWRGVCARSGPLANRRNDRSNGGSQPPMHAPGWGAQERLPAVAAVAAAVAPERTWRQPPAPYRPQHNSRLRAMRKAAATKQRFDLLVSR